MKKYHYFLVVILISCWNTLAMAQTKVDPAELSSSVPQLTEFHEIIFPMWHNAYPAKDYKALKDLVPGIKARVEAINGAELPGILRDKGPEWKNLLKELNNIAQSYYDAAAGNNNEALLAAAEKLHGQYERMVRALRPAIKEIDDYHQTLYVIYHKLLPDGKYDEIAALAGTLVTKAEAIMNYPKDKLKQRLGDSAAKFDASAKGLVDATNALKEALNGNDTGRKKQAVETMHSAYQKLDSLFD
jgi:hypothetical protein